MLAAAQDEDLARAKEMQEKAAAEERARLNLPPPSSGALWDLKGGKTAEINKIIKTTCSKPSKKDSKRRSKENDGGFGMDLLNEVENKKEKKKKTGKAGSRPEEVGGLVLDADGNVISKEDGTTYYELSKD